MGQAPAERRPYAAGLLLLIAALAVVTRHITAPDPWESWSRDRFWDTDRPLADPTAIWADGQFHVLSTSTEVCIPESCTTYWVPHFTSESLSQPGVLVSDAMPDLPAWVEPGDRPIWAPAIATIAGSFVLYFSATSARASETGSKCLGVAVSANVAGPFAPLPDPLHCSGGPGYWNIDPYAVTDGTGWYLLWREDDSANPNGKIVGAPLAPDGLAVAAEARQTLLVAEQPWEGESAEGRGPIENPALARHPETGEWLLTWSANRWETTSYATGLAVCQGPLGPCSRRSLETPWLHASSDGGFDTDADFVGSGGLSFVGGPDNHLYALLHAYRTDAAIPGSPRVGWAYRVTADNGYRLTEF